MSTSTMLFIVSSNTEKVDPPTRKQIRSHVMRGKKQKRIRRDNEPRLNSRQSTARRFQHDPIKTGEVLEMYTPLVPSRVGSDISFLELADEVEPKLVFNLLHS